MRKSNFIAFIPIFLFGLLLITAILGANRSHILRGQRYKYKIEDKNGNGVYANSYTIKGDSVLVPLSSGDTIRMGNISNITTF